ncbi:hypothetical protein PE36_00155 [Moritella sp. PE36]|nr:hypothetical protein PE36_00155 [Moritella sp. PE36]
MTKPCNTCFEFKDDSEFSKATKNIDGLQNKCKPCCAAYHQSRYGAGGDKTRSKYNPEVARRSRIKNAVKIAAYQLQYKAKQRAAKLAAQAPKVDNSPESKHSRLYRSVLLNMSA